MDIKTISLPVQIRLKTIEDLLSHYGYINRKIICDIYGLGEAQVSRDIADYGELNPDVIFYNKATLRIEKLSNFTKIFS